MTTPAVPDGGRRRTVVRVDARRLWSGGLASAVVTGLVALVGVLVSRWFFNLSVLAPKRDGAYGDIRTTALVLLAFAGALVATGLVHLLMLSTPRPLLFFGWIVALVTVLLVVFPFSTTAALENKVATSLIYLALGIATGTLVGSAAARSFTRTLAPVGEYPQSPYDRPQAYEQPQHYDQPPRYNPQPYDQPPRRDAQPYDRTQPYDQRYDPGRGTGYP